jgi:hypothetical protein
VADTPEYLQAVRDLKETLKARFDQLDIWITAHRIEIVERGLGVSSCPGGHRAGDTAIWTISDNEGQEEFLGQTAQIRVRW